MLQDTDRNEKFYEAIRLAVDKIHSRDQKAKVLNIEANGGLFAMMAVESGADSVIVSEPIRTGAFCAEEVFRINKLADKIKVVTKHSTALTVGTDGDLPERANILVADVFDEELIGDNALIVLNHAIKELIEPDSILVPSSGTIYAQIVECNLAENWNNCKDFLDDDGELLIKAPDSIKNCVGDADIQTIQLSQFSTDSFKQICAPQAVFHFDWSRQLPFSFNEHNVVETVAECDGTAQAVFFWWELSLNTDNTIIINCAPYWAHPSKQSNPNLTWQDIPWRNHWKQAIFYLPTEVPVKTGEEFNLVCCHDEYCFWFYFEPLFNSPQDYKKHICECSFHAVHTRRRIGHINDESRRKKYLSLIKKHVNSDSVVLCLGTGFYSALIAAKIAKKLIILDKNVLSGRVLREFIKTNKLSNVDIIVDFDELAAHANRKSITLVIGEPFYNGMSVSWDNAAFGYHIKKIKKYLNEEVIIIPRECTVKGILVEFQNLYVDNSPVFSCGEFSLEAFDSITEYVRALEEPFVENEPLWQFPSIAKSRPFVLAMLNMRDIKASILTSVKKQVKVKGEPNSCNAVAMWSEWDMDGTEDHMISTGPTVPTVIDETIQWDIHSTQGVHYVVPECENNCFIKFNFSYPRPLSSISTRTNLMFTFYGVILPQRTLLKHFLEYLMNGPTKKRN